MRLRKTRLVTLTMPIAAFLDFGREVEPYLDEWRSIDLRLVAMRTTDNRWVFNSLRILLDQADKGQKQTVSLPSAGDLLVAHERWEIDQLNHLLDCLSKGELTIRGETVLIKRFDGQNWTEVSTSNPVFEDRETCRSRYGVDCASFTLQIWESISDGVDHKRLQSAEDELRSGEPPYDGLGDLREDFIGLPKGMAQQTRGCTVHFIAPLNTRLSEGSGLDEDAVRVIIEKGPETRERDLRIAVISRLAQGGVSRRTYEVDELESVKRPDSIVATIHLPEHPSGIQLIVTYRNRLVDRMTFLGRISAEANPRLGVLRALGKDVQNTETLLRAAHGKNLTSWMALLIHWLGLNGGNYDTTGWGAPDIVAFPSEKNWFLVVECTEDEPNHNSKLSKLATRSNQIREQTKMERAYPVLVTTLKRSVISKTDLELASKEGIAIITQDELPTLFEMVVKGASPIELRDFLNGLVPSTSQF